MAEEEYIVGKCSQCGEELRVPARLEHFSCMFCGAKLTPADLVEELPPAAPLTGDSGELLARVRSDILRCVADYPDIRKQITRREYDPAFARYEEDLRGIFDDLDTACRLEPDRQNRIVEETVADFLDQLEARWAARKPEFLTRRTMLRDDDKMVIAIFLVPMVRHLGLSVSEEFCAVLQKRWVERYPKSPFYLGSYEDISGGFRRRFKLCFITTAVCEAEGKPDDCPELTAFRAFRDGYLMDEPDGPALVETYYEVAPVLLTCMRLGDDCAARCRELRERYLEPCYQDLQAGRMASCRDRYVEMVRELQARYLS